MALSDISWGWALAGAVGVTALVAVGTVPVITSLTALGLSKTAAWLTVAAVGAVTLEFLHDLTLQDLANGCGSAAKSLIGR